MIKPQELHKMVSKKTLAQGFLYLIVFFTSIHLSHAQASKKQPNVVLIYLDDIGAYNFPTYGGESMSASWKGKGTEGFSNIPIETPNIDKLSKKGLKCTQAFTHPVCEPSRISLMSGQHNDRNYIITKSQHQSQITFGDVFKKAGYATGIFGKWKQSRGNTSVPGIQMISQFGWDEHLCFDVTSEGQRFINPNLVKNGKKLDYKGRTDVDPITQRRWYGPDIINRELLNFIDTNKKKPFFAFYPMLLMHDPHKPTPDTKPKSIFDEYPEAKKANELKYFPDMLKYADKLVGNIIKKLNKEGLRDNTLVIFYSDNGTTPGVKIKMTDGKIIRGGKGFTNRSGENVPLIFNWPGNIKKGMYDGLTNVTDIFPTLTEACGIKIPNGTNLDGKSMWSAVTGDRTKEHRESIYRWYNGFYPMSDTLKRVRFAMNKKFKYYANQTDYPEGRFFDLEKDPLEKAGKKGRHYKFNIFWYDGKNLDQLTSEEKQAMQTLKKVTDRYTYKSIKSLKITGTKQLSVGQKTDLDVILNPIDVTMNNVIWESSDPSIATIDKFGVVTAKKIGKTTITVYSWDTAKPIGSKKRTTEFFKNGVKDTVEIKISAN